MWDGYGMGWGLGWLWLVLILVGLGLLVYVAVRVSIRQSSSNAPGSARRILEERYARGEIDTDEFTERLKNLSGG